MLSRYKWLNAATSKIRFPPDRKQVQQELTGHIEDLRDHYAAEGLDEEAAEAAALSAMGDPEAIADDLGRIHRPWLGYVWWLSKGLIAVSIVLCCVLAASQASQRYWGRLPGWALYDYLTWEFNSSSAGTLAERELMPGASVSVGGYTIQVEQAALRQYPEQSASQWRLELWFHIGTGWRNEELYWGANTIAEVRDSAGNTYPLYYTDEDRYSLCDSSDSVWGLGQKAALELYSVPEDVEWVEIDFGAGTLQRTLHFDIKEAAT